MRDLRQYARQTNRQLLIGALIILFLIGDGLIYLFYGREAAISGLICMGVGLVPILLIGGILQILGWIVHKAREE